jgi:hypothetical protein
LNGPSFYQPEFEPLWGRDENNTEGPLVFGALYVPYRHPALRRVFPHGSLGIIHIMDNILMDHDLSLLPVDYHVTFPHARGTDEFDVDVWCFTFPQNDGDALDRRQVSFGNSGVVTPAPPTAEEEIVLSAEEDLAKRIGADSIRYRFLRGEDIHLPHGLIASVGYE